MNRRLLVFAGIVIAIGVIAMLMSGGRGVETQEGPGGQALVARDAVTPAAEIESAALDDVSAEPAGAGPVRTEEERAALHQRQARELARFMEAVRNRGPGLEVRDSLEEDPKHALELLSGYVNDRSERVRQRANSMSTQLALERGSLTARRRVVDQLTSALGDPVSTVEQHAAQDLLRFDPEDFTSYAQSELVRLLYEPDPSPKVIRLVGLLGLEDEFGRLGELQTSKAMSPAMFESARYYGSVEWAATLARARLGSQIDLDVAIERVRLEENAPLRVADLLRQLAYTRQPEAIKYISEYLSSTEKLLGSKPQYGMPYSQHALDVLAAEIDGFPVAKQAPGTYSEADVATARAFMADQSNWANSMN